MTARRFLFALPALALCCAALPVIADDADTPADPATPSPPTPMATPAMSYVLTANPKPMSFDFGPLGTAYATGVVSALAFAQSDHVPGDRDSRADISNGQVFLQKTDGVVQYFVQAG